MAKEKEKNIDVEGKEIVPLEVKNKRMYITGIVVAVMVTIITVVAFISRISMGEFKTEVVVSEVGEEIGEADIEEVDTNVAEEYSSDDLERKDITLEILNGSGTSGLASETADIFEELGYEIVEIGNTSTTVGNKLFVSEDYEDLVGVLLDDAEEELDISSISGELDGDVIARIILGS